MKEIRESLIESDVNVQVADDLLEAVKAKAVGMEVTPNVKPDQFFVKVCACVYIYI